MLSREEKARIHKLLSEISEAISARERGTGPDNLKIAYITNVVSIPFFKWEENISARLNEEPGDYLGLMTLVKNKKADVEGILNNKVDDVSTMKTFIAAGGRIDEMKFNVPNFMKDNGLTTSEKLVDGTEVSYNARENTDFNYGASGILGKKVFGPAVIISQVLSDSSKRGKFVANGYGIMNRLDERDES